MVIAFQAASLYAAAKGVLKIQGMDIGGVRAPFLPLQEKDHTVIAHLAERIAVAEERYQDQ